MLKKIMSFIPLRYKILLCMGILIFTPLFFQEWSGRSMNVPVVLQEGFETEWRVWRPFDVHKMVRLEMAFPRMPNTELENAILGEYQKSKGEPVHIALTLNGKTCFFKQNHGIYGRSDERVLRELSPTPFNPNCAHFQEMAGQNHWHIKVIWVGDKLRGTQARLLSDSPYGSFKSIPYGIYGKIMQFNLFLGWFIAPIFVLWVFLQIFYDLFIRRLKKKQA